MKKIVVTKKLFAEIRKWERQFGVANPNVMRLLKLYIGMDVDYLFNKDGKILCQNFNRMAVVMKAHNPKRLIEMVVQSGSFIYEECNQTDWNIYGILWFASPLCLSDKLLSSRSENTPIDRSRIGDNLDIINNIASDHSACSTNGLNSGASGIQHPHGEYEYVVTGCTQRLYDIDGAAAPIPANAPDRPDGSAVWNKFLNKWITKNSEI